ncbi:MAG: NAD(+) synthase [Clostridia bacterium]|nr:NAD(+) synthase [Clostridia bacterium]
MFDYFRIACAVPDVEIGDVDFNIGMIKKYIEYAKNKDVDLLVFPELGTTGYTCADLFLQNMLIKSSNAGISILAEESRNSDMIIAVGAPIAVDGCLYNCAVIISNGKIFGVVPKTFIPNHGEHSEKRWFSSASSLNRNEISSKELGLSDEEYNIPVGSFVFDACGVKLGFEICEDLWAPITPSSLLCLNGAEIIANLAAGSEAVGKRSYRKELVKQQSSKNICAYALCSSGCLESTSDSVFSGHSIICENGKITEENKKDIESGYMIISDVDLGKIRRDRLTNTTFTDCKTLWSDNTDTVIIPKDESKSNGNLAQIKKLPFVPSKEKERTERCLSIFNMQVSGLKKRLMKTGCKPVIGISGGLDSTLALLVSVQAIKELERPLTDVIGITMPCFGTTDRTYNNSVNLMKSLGITSLEINIKDACLQHFKDIGQNEDAYDLTYENAQARERTQVLMDYAGKANGLVIGTGDMSELALGWCTYNGDHMSMYGVNSGIPKTLMRWMIDSLIKNGMFAESTEYLNDIVNTPISPELLPPDAKGEIAQQTESIVGPYALHDFFLYYVIRFGFEPDKIYALAKKAFANDFDGETIMKWLKIFYRRFFTQQFKRSCVPDGIRIGSVGLSPKSDFRMPSDACASIWLKKLENIEI